MAEERSDPGTTSDGVEEGKRQEVNFAELLRTIDEFDLDAYLQEKGFEPSRSKGGDEWIGDCPGCGKRKCCVDTKKRGFHCWICQEYEDFWSERDNCMKRRPTRGAGGVIALVRWLDEMDTKDAIEFLAKNSVFGTNIRELPDLRVIEEVLEAGESPTIAAPEGWQPITQPLPYMAQRRITMEDVQCFGLFFCASGKYRNRIVFPVWENGRLIYWQARAMYEESECQPGYRFIKALNPEQSPGAAVSSEVLMNLETAKHYPRVAIVEGPIDCVRTGPDAVCTFGKQMSPAQVRRLLVRGVRAVDLLWDGPKGKEPQGAWPEMFTIAPWLSAFFDVRLVFLPQGDPADWTREQLWEHRAAGVPAEHMSRIVAFDTDLKA